MKKLLPSSFKGFTLIELLVVIAIIAVLAVMGFAAFGGLTGSGNDARRRTDIKAITDVYEVKRVKAAAATYGGLALAADDFSGGKIPTDPVSTRNYCIKAITGSSPVPNATVGADGINASGVCTGTWTAVSSGGLTANATFFKACVLLTNNTTIECQGSKQ